MLLQVLIALLLCLLPITSAQSATSGPDTTSPSSPSPASATSPAATSFPATGTVTLNAPNGTATATIVNGTALNGTQSTTSAAAFPSLGNVSPCVINCLQSSVAFANCSSITDTTCFCSSASFRNVTVNCVSTQCPNELQSAEALAQQFCKTVSITLTFPPPSSSTGAPAATATRSGSGAQEMHRSPLALATLCGALSALVWLALNGW